MILSIGEILIDEFVQDGKSNKKAGGAPFNVAMNIARFKGDVGFFGVVGRDEDGSFLKNTAEKTLNKKAYIQVVNNKTSKAIVTVTNGERNFRFERDNASDYQFDLDYLKAIDLSKVSIVHFGSLMISNKKGLEFLHSALKYIKDNSKALISYDVNYREDIFENKENSLKLIKEIIKDVDILKISNDEVSLFDSESDIVEACRKLISPSTRCFISLGSKGSAYIYRDTVISIPSIKVKPIDTTGAGDAFYSYVLYSLDKKDLDLSNKDINDILKTANAVGALTTQGVGAIEPVPTLEEVNKFLQKGE